MIPEPHATPSAAPHFNALGVVFGAWNVSEHAPGAVSAPEGAKRTVWVSACGRIRCGGRVIERTPDDRDHRTTRMAYWCRLDGTLIETDAGSLLQAMQAGAILVARSDSAGAEPAGSRGEAAA